MSKPKTLAEWRTHYLALERQLALARREIADLDRQRAQGKAKLLTHARQGAYGSIDGWAAADNETWAADRAEHDRIAARHVEAWEKRILIEQMELPKAERMLENFYANGSADFAFELAEGYLFHGDERQTRGHWLIFHAGICRHEERLITEVITGKPIMGGTAKVDFWPMARVSIPDGTRAHAARWRGEAALSPADFSQLDDQHWQHNRGGDEGTRVRVRMGKGDQQIDLDGLQIFEMIQPIFAADHNLQEVANYLAQSEAAAIDNFYGIER